jgi:hypothetical protein
MKQTILRTLKWATLLSTVALMSASASAADHIEGRVEGGGVPIAGGKVTLWMAGPGVPQKLADTRTTDRGGFDLRVPDGNDGAGVLYLIAEGGQSKAQVGSGPNPAITLMATLGTHAPERVTINELTTGAATRWVCGSLLATCRTW